MPRPSRHAAVAANQKIQEIQSKIPSVKSKKHQEKAAKNKEDALEAKEEGPKKKPSTKQAVVKKKAGRKPAPKKKPEPQVLRGVESSDECDEDLMEKYNVGLDSKDFILPCREKEFEDIYAFARRAVIQKSGGCLYVSGVPGTGKTATISQVFKLLTDEYKSGLLPSFKLVQINGMRLINPKNFYKRLYYAISGEEAGDTKAEKSVTKMFESTRAKSKNVETILLFVDELDTLATKSQSILYQMFEWPQNAKNRFSIISAANTFDLPQRLMPRIASRIGMSTITFMPYTDVQLMEIARFSLSKNHMTKDALTLATRKIANESGDVRRILQLCKRAKAIAEEEMFKNNPSKHTNTKCTVTHQHVNAASTEMFMSPKLLFIRESCSFVHKEMLLAMLDVFKSTGLEKTNFSQIYERITQRRELNDEVNISAALADIAFKELQALGIISGAGKVCSPYEPIVLNMGQVECRSALGVNKKGEIIE